MFEVIVIVFKGGQTSRNCFHNYKSVGTRKYCLLIIADIFNPNCHKIFMATVYFMTNLSIYYQRFRKNNFIKLLKFSDKD